MKILSNISLSGQSPMEIAVNPLSNTGYILTNEFAGVIAMDLSNNELRYVAINESMAPFSLAVNRLKNLVYISDYST